MLAAQNSIISKISVLSKKKCQSSKLSPSTQNTQPHQGYPNKIKNNFTVNQNYWDQSSQCKRVQHLQKHIESMERQELQMEAKFHQCVESLLSQIQRNNLNNTRLATQVGCLKQQLAESRKDILIIEEYMRANLKKDVKFRQKHDQVNPERQSFCKNLLSSSSSSKNLQLRRALSKSIKTKLLQKQ